jgi:hypothetical protein
VIILDWSKTSLQEQEDSMGQQESQNSGGVGAGIYQPRQSLGNAKNEWTTTLENK